MPKRSGPATFSQATSLFFRSLFAFFILELPSRRVIPVGVTQYPTDTWTAQQLREATAYGQGPKYLLRDNDSKFGAGFARVAHTSRIEILKTPYQAPRANAICERFLGSVRRECPDHLLILHEKQHEPRTGRVCPLLQPSPSASRDQAADSRTQRGANSTRLRRGKVLSLPVLGGLTNNMHRKNLLRYSLHISGDSFCACYWLVHQQGAPCCRFPQINGRNKTSCASW